MCWHKKWTITRELCCNTLHFIAWHLRHSDWFGWSLYVYYSVVKIWRGNSSRRLVISQYRRRYESSFPSTTRSPHFTTDGFNNESATSLLLLFGSLMDKNSLQYFFGNWQKVRKRREHPESPLLHRIPPTATKQKSAFSQSHPRTSLQRSLPRMLSPRRKQPRMPLLVSSDRICNTYWWPLSVLYPQDLCCPTVCQG